MHDVLRDVLCATRDEDLGATHPVGPITRLGGHGLHIREAAACLGLSEGHRARPLPAVHLVHEQTLNCLIPEGLKQPGCAGCESLHRVDAEVCRHEVAVGGHGDHHRDLGATDFCRAGCSDDPQLHQGLMQRVGLGVQAHRAVGLQRRGLPVHLRIGGE